MWYALTRFAARNKFSQFGCFLLYHFRANKNAIKWLAEVEFNCAKLLKLADIFLLHLNQYVIEPCDFKICI